MGRTISRAERIRLRNENRAKRQAALTRARDSEARVLPGAPENKDAGGTEPGVVLVVRKRGRPRKDAATGAAGE